MGITIKPLVKCLNIRMEHKHTLSLFNALNTSVLDEMLSVLEIIINCKRRNVIREFIKHIDEKYFRHILQNNPEYYNEKLFKIYEKISLCLHYVAMHPNQSKCLLTDLPESIIYKYLTNQLTPMPINAYNNNNNNNDNNNNNAMHDVLNTYSIDMNTNHETDQMVSINHETDKQSKEYVKKRKYPFNNYGNKMLTQNKQLDEGNINQYASTSNNQQRNTRRHAILPIHTNEQTDFNNKFLNILSLRNHELMMNIRNQSSEKLSLPQSSMTSMSTIPMITPLNTSITSIQMKDDVTNNEMNKDQLKHNLQSVIQDKRNKNHLH
uniref:SJCHGC09225 protein n=1 Tax=Schistosoma japonicum TaxID=6182 RepID=Q5D9Q4_SCHJA|nr:SJCHGC09225 protein [Schistosoma japonicum]